MSGFIKLHRSLKEWEWYDDHNATRLLVHLLVSVNFKDKKWHGVLIKKGSMIFSWNSLSDACGLSVKQCRSAMEKLEASGEISKERAGKWQVVTLVKWDKMQIEEVKGAAKRQEEGREMAASGQQKGSKRAATKEGNKDKNEEEGKEGNTKKIFTKKDFRETLLKMGADSVHVEDWLKVREKKKLAPTETALRKFIKECEENNFPIDEAVMICAERSWGGFQFKWIENERNQKQFSGTKKGVGYSDSFLEEIASDLQS